MDRLDDPNADGWPTEALAEEAKQQLKGLGKLILNPGEINSESLRQFVSDDISFHSLETEDSKPVFSDSVLHIVRMPDQPAESKQQGLAKIETALRNLGAPLTGGRTSGSPQGFPCAAGRQILHDPTIYSTLWDHRKRRHRKARHLANPLD